MQQNPKYFSEPDKFLPERFEGTRGVDTQSPFLYIPFSAGPRNCIGQKFAMYEMKSILSKILRHYDVHLTKDSDIDPVLSSELILRPDSSICFTLDPRVY